MGRSPYKIKRRTAGPIRVRGFAYRRADGKIIRVKSFRRAAPGSGKRRITK